MAEPLGIRPLLRPKGFAEVAPEDKAFAALKVNFKRKENSRIVKASFCPAAPHRLALVTGTKVGLWQPTALKEGSLEEGRSLTKFKDLTQCVAWRSDGRLLLVGEAGGSCAVVEAEKNAVLRRLRGHGDAVTCASFAADKGSCATGCKDGKLRLWDAATSELLQEVVAHADCLKCLSVGPGDTWITAGYDQKVKLWDFRSKAEKASIKVDHGHQVEAGVAFPSGSLFASGGGVALKLWDFTMTGRALQDLSDAHSKAIMDLALDSKASVLLSASFDSLVKVWKAADLSHVHTYRNAGPCTCVAWQPAGGFVVGLDDGSWSLRSQGKAKKKALKEGEVFTAKRILRRGKQDGPLRDDEEEESDVERQKSKKWKREEGFLRGRLHQPEADDQVVERRQFAKREPKAHYLFRKFEYKKLGELLFTFSANDEAAFGVIDELIERGALAAALTDQGEENCLVALKWLMKCFGSGDSMQELLTSEVLSTLVNCNECLRPPSTKALLDALKKVAHKVGDEIRIQEALFETNGAVESMFCH